MRVTVFGCGRMGAAHAVTLRALDAELSVVDVDEGRAREVAAELGADMRRDVRDAVSSGTHAAVVATSTSSHAELVRELLASGIPTFCEKPLAPTLGEIRTLGGCATASRVPLQVGFHRRFDPAFRAVRDAAANGRVGQPRIISVASHDPEPARDPVATAGTIFRDLQIHDFDVLRWVTGAEVATISSRAARLADPAPRDPADFDTVASLAELTNGALGVLTAGRANASGYELRLEVLGSRGVTRLAGDEHAEAASAGPPTFLRRFEEAYRAEIAHFLAVARGNARPACTWEDAYASLQIALAAEASLARDGRAVVVHGP